MQKSINIVKKISLAVAIIGMALSLILGLLIVETSPRAPTIISSSDNYVEATRATKSWIHALNSQQRNTVLSVAKEQIHALNAVANDQFSNTQFSIHLQKQSIKVELSQRIYKDLAWLNIQAQVFENAPFYLRDIRIGKLKIPSPLANYIYGKTIQYISGYSIDSLKYYVSQVQLSEQNIVLTLKKPKNINTKIQSLVQHLNTLREKPDDFNDEKIAYYYRFFSAHTNTPSTHSLGHYIGYAISDVSAKGKELKSEITSILFALALLSDNGTLHNLLASRLKANGLITTKHSFTLTLNARKDLSKHFIYSALIKALSNQKTAILVGEAKELIDTNGGSGFSFMDLAADRAGIAFIQAIQKDANNVISIHAQNTITDALLLPQLHKVDEGLDQQTFDKRYVSTNSEVFHTVVRSIDKQILNSILYQQLNKI